MAAKACRLPDEGQLGNAALAPLLKAAVAGLTGLAPKAVKPAKAPTAPTPAPSALLLAQQPVLAVWQADNGAHLAKAYLEHSKQYVNRMERFGPQVTLAAVDEKWAKRYTAFLVRDTPFFNTTIHQHLYLLRNLVAHAGLPTKFITQPIPSASTQACKEATRWGWLMWRPRATGPPLSQRITQRTPAVGRPAGAVPLAQKVRLVGNEKPHR